MKAAIPALAVVSLLFSGCAARHRAQPKTDAYDQDFLYRASDHLMHDRKITKACPGKDIRKELRDFCGALDADLAREEQQLNAWLQTWFSRKPPVDPNPLWLESQDGETFERFFLRGLIRGHREVAARARACVSEARHGEMTNLCKEIEAHRTEEADRLERWGCRWFGECP